MARTTAEQMTLGGSRLYLVSRMADALNYARAFAIRRIKILRRSCQSSPDNHWAGLDLL